MNVFITITLYLHTLFTFPSRAVTSEKHHSFPRALLFHKAVHIPSIVFKQKLWTHLQGFPPVWKRRSVIYGITQSATNNTYIQYIKQNGITCAT